MSSIYLRSGVVIASLSTELMMASLDIPELAEIVSHLEKILENQRRLSEQLHSLRPNSLPAWIGLKEACALKGVGYSTIQKAANKHLMPPLSERQRVGKALKWPREVILKWLLQRDQELKEVRDRLSKAQTINATPKPMDEIVAKEPAPVYSQMDEALRLINEIEKHTKSL
jgi:hypothetical protein